MAHSSRGWTGARTPSAIKRVRQAARRRAVNQPRRSAAKTLVNKAIVEAGNGDAEQARDTLARALSALDRAAKIGAIHRNAADRRKSRLTLKVNAALGGEALVPTGKLTRTTGKAAAAKQARARIAASKATRSKGDQTAAGKAREALARTTRAGSAAEANDEQQAQPAKPATGTRATASRSTGKTGKTREGAAKTAKTAKTPQTAKASKTTKDATAAEGTAKPRASRTPKKS